MAEQKYWSGRWSPAVDLEFRGAIAYDLIRAYGSIAGKAGEEDRSGRAKLDLQTPEELVDRCFKIADLLVNRLEQRGEVREYKNEGK